MRNIDLIREVTSAAANNWPHVLAGLNIDVPDSPQDVQHVAGRIASGSTTTGAALTSAISAVLATA